MIIPTVGEVLDFWPGPVLRYDDFSYFDASMPCACTVTYVLDERSLNVNVLDQHGRSYPYTEVVLVQPGDVLPKDQDYATFTDAQLALSGQALPATHMLQRELDVKRHSMHPHPRSPIARNVQRAQQRSQDEKGKLEAGAPSREDGKR